MFNKISCYRAHAIINLFKKQNEYYLRTTTRSFISPVTIRSHMFNNSLLEIQNCNGINNSNKVFNFKIDKNILPLLQIRSYCSNKKRIDGLVDNKNKANSEPQQQEPKLDIDDDITKQLSIFAKFKLMYKKYWYVLIPVHLITSTGWFFGFYFLSQSGVDIPTVLENLSLSETLVDKVRNSKMGHFAIAYLLYKLVTPVRYALTLGGTTVSIRYLVRLGYIKPVLTKQQVIDKFKKAKDDLKEDLKQRRSLAVKKQQDKDDKSTKS